jgi:hypothetical protein
MASVRGMALVRWKDLCIDANDPARLAEFWGTALGRRVEVFPGGNAVLNGPTKQHAIWINGVPEPKTVKHRLHVDVGVTDLQPLIDLGATVLRPQGDDGIRWTLMADPDGGEFCAFLRDEIPTDAPAHLHELVLDCASSKASEREAAWWAELFGGTADEDGRGFWWVQDIPDAPFECISFIPVSEPKTIKNRLHWDVAGDDLDGLLAQGATVLREPTDDDEWTVLADPPGNEFCWFHRPASPS